MKFPLALWDREGCEDAQDGIAKHTSMTIMGFQPARTNLKLSVEQMHLQRISRCLLVSRKPEIFGGSYTTAKDLNTIGLHWKLKLS